MYIIYSIYSIVYTIYIYIYTFKIVDYTSHIRNQAKPSETITSPEITGYRIFRYICIDGLQYIL